MKTAISLPDVLKKQADETAAYMGLARSQLFALALEEFLSNHNRQMIIDKINMVCDHIDQTEFAPYQNTTLESMRGATQNDSW